jgi:hypothetical protein
MPPLWGSFFGIREGSHVVITDQHGIRIRYGDVVKFNADPDGNLTLAGNLTIGTAGIFRTAAATALDTGIGIYGAGGTTPVFRIGDPSGSRIRWDGSELTVAVGTDIIALDDDGIRVAPPPSSLDQRYGYSFASVLSGNNVVGLHAIEPTSTSRELRVTNSTSVGGRAVTSLLQSINGNNSAVISAIVDAADQSVIGLNATLVTILSNVTVGASVLLGSGGIFTWSADTDTYLANDLGNGIAIVAGGTNICHFRSGSAAVFPGGNGAISSGFSTNRWSTVYSVNADDISSDRRLKSDIAPCDLGTDFLRQLQPVSFLRQSGGCVGRSYGLIAQEVEAALAGREVSLVTRHDDFYGLRYDELIAPLITGFQEVDQRVVALEAEVQTLQTRLQALEGQ